MVLETVALVAYLWGQPVGTPGFLIETFEDQNTCLVYMELSGWEMVRSTFGIEPVLAHVPVKGIELVCQSRV